MPLSKNHNFDNHLTVGYLPGMDNWLLVGDLLRLGRIFTWNWTIACQSDIYLELDDWLLVCNLPGQLVVSWLFTWTWTIG